MYTRKRARLRIDVSLNILTLQLGQRLQNENRHSCELTAGALCRHNHRQASSTDYLYVRRRCLAIATLVMSGNWNWLLQTV